METRHRYKDATTYAIGPMEIYRTMTLDDVLTERGVSTFDVVICGNDYVHTSGIRMDENSPAPLIQRPRPRQRDAGKRAAAKVVESDANGRFTGLTQRADKPSR